MTKDKETKLEKLRKLLALADGNDNEAEAMAAIAKAQDYAAQHGLNLEDLKDAKRAKEAAAGYGRGKRFYSGRYNADARLSWAPADFYLSKAIAFFCDVEVGVMLDEDNDNCVMFFGHEVDVELAQYLRDKLNRTMTFEAKAASLGWGSEARPEHWTKPRDIDAATRKAIDLRHSFLSGFADRVATRMRDVRADRAAATVGTELVVLKKEMLARKVDEMGFQKAHYSAGKRYAHDATAYAAGASRGDAADLGRGVGGGNTKMLAR